jgi:hypothetical protein
MVRGWLKPSNYPCYTHAIGQLHGNPLLAPEIYSFMPPLTGSAYTPLNLALNPSGRRTMKFDRLKK